MRRLFEERGREDIIVARALEIATVHEGMLTSK